MIKGPLTMNKPGHLDVSFVIPCRNDAAPAAKLCRSITREMKGRKLSYEMIISATGGAGYDSSMYEKLIDEQFGLIVTLCPPGSNAGEVRNNGAALARGEILVFLDADMLLRPSWGYMFSISVAPKMKQHADKTIITGSHGIPTGSSGWINQSWFIPRYEKIKVREQKYIGAGHMIMSAATFKKLNGFSPRLITGEDVDICRRADRIFYDETLEAVHTRFPTTLREFFRREMWHGTGDWASIETVTSSRPVIAAVVYFVFVVCLIYNVLAGNLELAAWLAGLAVFALTVISFAKFPNVGPESRVQNVILLAAYISARFMSIFNSRGKGRPYEHSA